jgi:hypothetical protein
MFKNLLYYIWFVMSLIKIMPNYKGDNRARFIKSKAYFLYTCSFLC